VTVAAAHHMSERTPHRLFGATEHPVAELIRLLRLQAVLRDLRATESAGDAITRVASRRGCHDMPHFNRVFKAHYGMTPSQGRRTRP
jgi:AraC-like DNA-binding protein